MTSYWVPAADRFSHRTVVRTVVEPQGKLIPEQFQVEDQDGVGRDDRRLTAWFITEIRQDIKAPLPADAHPVHALILSPDDISPAELKAVRAAPVTRAIELCAIREPASVMHSNLLPKPSL